MRGRDFETDTHFTASGGSPPRPPVDPHLSRVRAAAARAMHAKHPPSRTTLAARRAFQRRFEAEAIANGARTPGDIKTMAASARATYYAKFSKIGVEARKRKCAITRKRAA
jgi:hypothetical protein